MGRDFVRFLRASVTPWLVAAVACVSISVFADSDHTGKVTLTGVSIPGATVTAKQGEKTIGTITDQGGVYRFTGLADGTWTVTVKMVGFETITRDVTLPSAAEGVWELALMPIEKIVGKLPAPRTEPVEPAAASSSAQPRSGQKPPANAARRLRRPAFSVPASIRSRLPRHRPQAATTPPPIRRASAPLPAC